MVDFGRHRGADPARDHQPGENRGEFPRDRQDDHGRDRALGVEARKAAIALQCQNHAGKHRGQADHGKRIIPDLDNLAQQQPGIEGRADDVADADARENGETSGRGQETQQDAADGGNEIHDRSPPAGTPPPV